MKQKLTTLITILGVFFAGFSFVFGDSGIPSVSSISYGNKSTQETGMWYVLFGKNLAKKRVNDSFHHDMFISYATPYTDDGSDPKSCDDAKSEKKFPRDDYNQENPLKSNESQALVVDVLDSYGNMNMSIFDSVRAKEGRKVRFCVYDLSDNVIFDRIISTDFKNCLKDLQKEGGIKFDRVSSEIDNAHTTLILDTKNCKSMPLSVSFYSEKKAEALAGDGIIASLVGLVNPAFGIALISGSIVDKLGTLLPLHLSVNRNKEDYIELVPEKDKVKVSIKLSDQGCFTGQDPDCLIWTKVALPSDGAIASTAGFLGEEYKKAQTQGDNYKIANAYKKGVIMSECSGATGCSSFPSPWEIIKVTGAKTSYGKTLEVGVNQANYDKNSPCYSSELGGYKPGCYEFLAPIDFDANGGNLNGVQSKEGRTWIENIREFRFGDYVNFLFRIAISALVIISVVMIMVAGIEYMTVESLFGKSQAKARIKGAVGGLILALASYTILHTLNPKLLDMSALDNMEVAKLSDVDGDDGNPVSNIYIPKGSTKICKAGFTGVPTHTEYGKIYVCKEYKSSSETVLFSENLSKMLDDANKENIKLFGYGYRSPEKQIEHRKKNCGNSKYDIYEKPAKDCHPPTAIPGTSRHGNGLAVDFTCGGKNNYINLKNRKAETEKCWNWLKANAAKYHFYNLPSENWHWSIDGR